MMIINVLTLFPEMFTAVTKSSILGRAVENGILDVKLVNIRDYTLDKHRKTDDSPFGGGVGMVMTADPVFRAIKATLGIGEAGGASANLPGRKTIYMSPRGKVLDHGKIMELSREEEITILCGHYEGVDQRILDYWDMEEISIGDYILTGGELAAMVLIDAVARMIPNVLGESASASEESIYSGLLEYPQYTKPRTYEGMDVPEVLVNGNHELIRLWQLEQSLALTKERRPDLLKAFIEDIGRFSKKELQLVKKIME